MRWMTVGHGKIATAFVTAAAGLEDHEVVTVVGRSAERAAAFAARHGISDSGTSIAAAADGVDAVYIGTPHPSHLAAAAESLRAGVPVLCEKPMTMSAADTASLVDLARREGVFLMEAVWMRFLPIYRHVLRWLNDGRVGGVRGVQATFGFNAPFDPSHRLFDRALGGGALYDIGIYPLHLAHWMLGEPSTLTARTSTAPTGVDDGVAIIGTYNGTKLSVLTATTRADLDSRATIWGDQGRIELPMFWKGQSASLVIGGTAETIEEPFRINGYEYEMEEVRQCLADGRIESEGMPWSASIEIAKQVDEVLAATGYPLDGSTR